MPWISTLFEGQDGHKHMRHIQKAVDGAVQVSLSDHAWIGVESTAFVGLRFFRYTAVWTASSQKPSESFASSSIERAFSTIVRIARSLTPFWFWVYGADGSKVMPFEDRKSLKS